MKCKNCGTEFQEGIFCPECGTKFQEKTFCPECGSKLRGRNFCTECGTRIRRNISTPVSDQSNNDNLIIEKQGEIRGRAKAGLVCSILSFTIIIAVAFIALIFPSESDHDLSNTASVIDGEFSEVAESGVKYSEEVGMSASDEQYRDGVSDEYLSYLFQMDTEAIIQEYHEKGYEYVWLTSHVVKAPEEGMIGDPGTVDVVYFDATHVDGDGYFSITVTYGVVYLYWGKEIGWKNNFEDSSVVDFDFSAFNDSYWRITDKNRLLTLADIMVEDIPTNDQGEISAKQIDGYITFTNFDTFKYLRDFEFASEYVLGKIVVIVDGRIYEMDIICDYYAYSHKMRLINGYDAWDIGLEIDTYSKVTGIHWSSDSTSEIQRITQREFEAALGGAAVNIQEIDGNNHELNSDEIVDKYGTYSVDNGIDANLEADVGVYTGEDGGDYIRLDALSYGGRYLVEYEGVLIRIQGNIYEADDGYGNKLECVFDEGGMNVTVISAEFDVFYTLEGYYFKTEGINFDEVG